MSDSLYNSSSTQNYTFECHLLQLLSETLLDDDKIEINKKEQNATMLQKDTLMLLKINNLII